VGPGEASLLSQLAAVSLAEAIAEAEPAVAPQIKWPNDLLLGERKVAGILVEVKAEADRVDYVVVGIGINCNHTLADFPPALQTSATSLALAAGKPVSRLQVAQSLYRHLDAWYLRFAKGWREPIVTRLNALSGTLGRWVRVETGGSRPAGNSMRPLPRRSTRMGPFESACQMERFAISCQVKSASDDR
jgi:BirA family biotin operon repressor/biotin-[acetyl-CoA-carboxylase] ligase